MASKQQPYNARRVVRNTIYLNIRMVLVTLVGIYTTRIVLQGLGVDNYGLYNVIGGLVSMLSFFTASLSNSTQRFLNIHLCKDDIEHTRKVFNTSMLIYAGFALLLLVAAETIGLWFVNEKLNIPEDRMWAANVVYQVVIAQLVISLLSAAFKAEVVAHEDMNVYAYLSIVDVVIKLAIAYSITVIDCNDKLVLYSLLILVGSLIDPLINVVYARRKYEECRLRFTFNKGLIREQTSFIGWNMTFSSMVLLQGQGINILLNLFWGLAVNAARGLAMYIDGALLKFSGTFNTAVKPQITKCFSCGDYEGMQKLICRFSKYEVLTFFILCSPFICYIGDVLKIWIGKYPPHTESFTRLVLLYSLTHGMTQSIWCGVQATGRLKNYVLWNGAILVLSFTLSYIALRCGYAPESVFVCMLACRMLYIGSAILVFKRLVPTFSIRGYLSKSIWPTIRVIAVSVPVYALALRYCTLEYGFIGFVVNMLTIAILAVAIVCSMGLDRTELILIKDNIIKKIKR